MSKKFRLIGFLTVFIIVFISLGALSAANLNDNSSTDLGANSSNQGQVLSTVIDSNNSDNSNVVNNHTNSNLNKAVNNDDSINNSLDSSTNSTKTLNNQVSDNSNKVNNSNISSKSSTQVLKASSKPTSFSISQITSASKTVKAYYIANGQLPSTVTVGSVKLTLAQFLYYQSKAISQLNSNNKANIKIIGSLDEPSRPNSGDSVNGKLSKSDYVDSATRTYKFILNYDQGPNYSTTTIGKVSYNRLIEAFSVVLDYYNSNNKLPSTINVKYNSKTTIPSSTPNTNTSTKSFTFNQIVSASEVVKEYYDKNGQLPSTVTVGSVKLTLAQFLYYQSKAISQLNSNNKANIQIVNKKFNEPSRPNTGDSINKKLSKSGYVDSATRTYKYILNNNQGPNYSTTTVGRVSYNKLIETFCEVLSYYENTKALPASVYVHSNRVGNYTYMSVPSTTNYLNGGIFTVTLKDSQGNIVKSQKISLKINGITYTNTTNSKGVANFVIPKLNGKYTVNYYYTNSNKRLSSSGSKTISIINSNVTKITGTDLNTLNNSNVKYNVTLKDAYGNPIANQQISFKISGISTIYTGKTNSKGIASVTINLPAGNYIITYSFAGNSYYPKSSGMSNISVSNMIRSISINSLIDSANWVKDQYSAVLNGTKYTFDKYGVSSDGKYIMAIGRPSANGELSKYGYTFYRSVFERKCPICGGTHLYWSIFWAGNEYDTYGVFPATGNKEGGSAEGHIFCADCDADFSCIDGLNHVNNPVNNLKKLVATVRAAKSDAYELLNGSMKDVDISSTVGKLPSMVTIEGTPFSLNQYFYYVCRAISQLDDGNTKDLSLINILDSPSDPNRGDSISGASLSKSGYVDSATRTYKFILNYDQCPNYSTTTVGRVPYNNLVKLFTEVLVYYGNNKKLPSSITVNT